MAKKKKRKKKKRRGFFYDDGTCPTALDLWRENREQQKNQDDYFLY